MKEHIFLRILDKIKLLYTSMGVDYEKMRLILKYKLTMDSRRTSTLVNGKKLLSYIINYVCFHGTVYWTNNFYTNK